MFRNSPKLSDEARMLRCEAIKQLAELSTNLSQQDLDTEIFVDVEGDEIVGFDLTALLGMPNVCVGTRIPLGRLTADV
jgi:hypothetical protein